MLPHSLFPLQLILLSWLPALTYNSCRHRWIVFFQPLIFFISGSNTVHVSFQEMRPHAGGSDRVRPPAVVDLLDKDVEESESRPAFSKRVKMHTGEAENQFALIPEEDFPPSAQTPPPRLQHLPVSFIPLLSFSLYFTRPRSFVSVSLLVSHMHILIARGLSQRCYRHSVR